jgi:hypothetical protein
MVGESINLPDLGTKLGIDKLQQAAAQGQLRPQQPGGAGGPTGAPSGPQAQSQPRPAPKVQKGRVSARAAPQKAQNAKARMAGVGLMPEYPVRDVGFCQIVERFSFDGRGA